MLRKHAANGFALVSYVCNHHPMCGRYSANVTVEDLGQRFGVSYKGEPLPANHDVRPTQVQYTILNRDSTVASLARWGITPSWTGAKQIINARSDSLASKPMYRQPLKERRCLIPANAFYEWRGEVGYKHKFRFTLKHNEPFAFAGIWQEEKNEVGVLEPHFVIITIEPNEIVATIHNRMPAILIPDDEAKWLSPDTDEREALSMLQPYPAANMRVTQEPTSQRTLKPNSL